MILYIYIKVYKWIYILKMFSICTFGIKFLHTPAKKWITWKFTDNLIFNNINTTLYTILVFLFIF